MKCPKCGLSLESTARFCGACGHRMNEPSAVPSAPPRMAPRAQVAPPALGAPAAGGKYLPPNAVPNDPYIGTLLNNRFQIEAKLGEGGFGAVYRATQTGIGRVVALKLLHPEMTRDQNLVARFRREGLVLCNLRDAHTITTYDFDQTPDGTLYIAMELLEGRSLHDLFHDEAPIDWRRMFKIVAQMCSSLAEAHEQGIIHRDLKPENVHLEKRPGDPEFVKILDFGIAKVVHGDVGGAGPSSPQLTATGQTLGTLEYMSPEQLMGKALDGRSDVYALGVVAYELITGRLPFPDAKGPAGLITAQLRQTPDNPSVAHAAGDIPAGVDQIILTCLAKDKAQRFDDVTALRKACEEILSTGGTWSGASAEMARGSAPQPAAGEPAKAPSAPVISVAPASASAPISAHAAIATAPVPSTAAALANAAAPSTAAALNAAKAGTRVWLWIVVGVVVIGGGVLGALLALR